MVREILFVLIGIYYRGYGLNQGIVLKTQCLPSSMLVLIRSQVWICLLLMIISAFIGGWTDLRFNAAGYAWQVSCKSGHYHHILSYTSEHHGI